MQGDTYSLGHPGFFGHFWLSTKVCKGIGAKESRARPSWNCSAGMEKGAFLVQHFCHAAELSVGSWRWQWLWWRELMEQQERDRCKIQFTPSSDMVGFLYGTVLLCLWTFPPLVPLSKCPSLLSKVQPASPYKAQPDATSSPTPNPPISPNLRLTACSGLNCVPHPVCLSPKRCTCEGDLIWK